MGLNKNKPLQYHLLYETWSTWCLNHMDAYNIDVQLRVTITESSVSHTSPLTYGSKFIK